MAEQKKSVEATVRNIRRATRKKYTAEEKVRIVLEGLRGDSTNAELCRKEGIQPNLYYKWSKEFLEAGKQRLIGDTQRQADSQEVVEMRGEIEQLKQVVADIFYKCKICQSIIPSAPNDNIHCKCGNIGIDKDLHRLFVKDYSSFIILNKQV
jgi:transposase